MIAVQLDLKGLVHRPAACLQLLADLAGQGVNAVVVEYEDVFPFAGLDLAFDPATVWTREQLREFLATAARHGIAVIPLQQCLGHLEYVFRWQRYAGMAEDRGYPSTLALDHAEGRALVANLLEQMLAAHPDSRYIHLGMDEAHGLAKAAQRTGRSILALFVEHLETLLAIVERHGRTPIIWSDMLEDHFEPGLIERLRDRVVLCTWDYVSSGRRSFRGRLLGWRTSKTWLDEAENPEAPPIGAGTPFFEDLPEAVAAQLAPYRHGREVDTFFQVDMWTKLGFRVLGATAIRKSSDGAILPLYHKTHANIRGFAEAIRRHGQLGLLGTSWARGNTFCPPNFPIEAAWPSVAVLATAMGAQPPPFFAGVDPALVLKLAHQLGRSRQDWSYEEKVAAQLSHLTPQVTSHLYEWECLVLLTRTLALHRRVNFAISEVDYFLPGYRPVTTEWERRLRDQETLRFELASLRQELAAHFGQRYHGEHFAEWLRSLCDVPAAKLEECTRIARERHAQARARYGW
jgi:hypothetical protein